MQNESAIAGAKTRPRTDTDKPWLLVLLAASLALNVLLGLKLEGLKFLGSGVEKADILSKGELLSPIAATDLNGQTVTIAFSDTPEPTVVYVFTPPCRWCERNVNNVLELFARRRSEYRFVGLSLSESGLRPYLDSHQLGFPVYTRLNTKSVSAMRLGATPETIVVSRDGRVIRAWVGAYQNDVQRDVEAFFKVKLPGLTPASPNR